MFGLVCGLSAQKGSRCELPLFRQSEFLLSARASDVGMRELLDFLRQDGEGTRELKSCSPFAGVLTREARDQFTCAWTH